MAANLEQLCNAILNSVGDDYETALDMLCVLALEVAGRKYLQEEGLEDVEPSLVVMKAGVIEALNKVDKTHKPRSFLNLKVP
jgi:hypothetical protein